MATRLLGAKLNLLSVRDVLSARDGDKSDGGGLLLRCAAERAAWVFRYTSTTGKRRLTQLETKSNGCYQAPFDRHGMVLLKTPSGEQASSNIDLQRPGEQ